MKSKYPALLFLILAISGCMSGNPKKIASGVIKDTLVYNYKTIKEKQSNCGNRPDSTCTIISIRYPQFNGQQALNDTINHLDFFTTTDKPDSNLNQFAKSYLEEQKLIFNKPEDIRYSLDLRINIVGQDSDLVILKIEGDTYYAGTNGVNLATDTYYINWDTKHNKEIKLTDIFSSGYEDHLNQIGQSIFRKEEDLDDTTSLKTDYRFEDGKFSLPDNFLITPLGLIFTYNPGDIMSRAASKTDIVIPYTKIKSLLLPHTVVSQYIK